MDRFSIAGFEIVFPGGTKKNFVSTLINSPFELPTTQLSLYVKYLTS